LNSNARSEPVLRLRRRGRFADAPPGAELLGWLPLMAMGLMVFNDQVLRTGWPCWFTGKLSDFAVVLFFPFLLTATWGWIAKGITACLGRGAPSWPVLDHRLSRPRLAAAIVLTGLVLAAINLSPTCRDLYLVLVSGLDFLNLGTRHTYMVDPTDCLALALLPVTWGWGVHYIERHEEERA